MTVPKYIKHWLHHVSEPFLQWIYIFWGCWNRSGIIV